MSGLRLRIWSAVAVAVTISVAATAGMGAIKQRQEAMEAVRDGMMTLGSIAKKEQPFDAEVVKASAASIADHLAKAAELFPEGSGEGGVAKILLMVEGQTWAKPEIWTDRAHFDEILESTHQAAVELQSVTEASAFPPALGKLGNGCKTCHDMYRLPKN